MILFTGLTGKSGGWLLRNLIENAGSFGRGSYKVITRSSSGIESILQSGLSFEILQGDLTDQQFLFEALENVDVVFHIAGIQTSLNIIRAAIKNDVKWVILVHTTGIYSKYKTASEEYRNIENKIQDITKDKDIALTILRPTMIYGSINDNNIAVFIKMVDKLRIFPLVNHAKYPLQPVHCKDLGKAYFQVLSNRNITEGRNYILSGKHPIMLIDILKAIAQKLGRKNYFFSIPFPIAYSGSVLLYYLSLKKFDFREKVQRLVEARTYSHEEASKDFGYSPMDFEQGIEDEILEYQIITKTSPS